MIEINNIDTLEQVLNRLTWWNRREVNNRVAESILKYYIDNPSSENAFFNISKSNLLNIYRTEIHNYVNRR